LDSGRTTVTAKANRYGYADSAAVAVTFEIDVGGE